MAEWNNASLINSIYEAKMYYEFKSFQKKRIRGILLNPTDYSTFLNFMSVGEKCTIIKRLYISGLEKRDRLLSR